jgi:D-3-phosphoglycerate dehydrogenase
MKCLVLGDPIVPSSSMFPILRSVGSTVQFVLLDWRSELGLGDFYKVALELESKGPIELPEDMHDHLKNADIIVTDYAPISGETIRLASNLRLIGTIRGGTENIDLTEAQKRGVPVVHAPGRNATSVADFTLGLMIALHRHIASTHCLMKQGIWDDRWSGPEGLSTELSGMTVGIIGYGKVGKKVAHRCEAFGMKILVYDPYAQVDERTDNARSVDLETLLRSSDFVTLHARLHPDTISLISRKELDIMKPSAYLINTARAPLVDEGALIDVLSSGRLRGAALDVFSEEPMPPDSRVKALENVVLTPHLAGSTIEGELSNGVRMVAEEIQRFIMGVPLVNVIR